MENKINQEMFKSTIVDELQQVMKKNGHLTNDDIIHIANKLNVSNAQVYGVATFYSQFTFRQNAKYLIEVCDGTACFLLGSTEILHALEKRLNATPFQNTADNKFCIATVRCLGACAESPVMKINGTMYTHLSPKKAVSIIDELEAK